MPPIHIPFWILFAAALWLLFFLWPYPIHHAHETVIHHNLMGLSILALCLDLISITRRR